MPPDLGAHAGRYVIGDEIASGGMATVHLGKMRGDAGFARTVAIKRLHAQFTRDAELCAMLLDEGRLAARIHHLNVVTTLDVVATGDDLFIVMEYVHGEPLSALIRAARRKGQQIPPRVVSAILSGALRGLHAAHEARDVRGEPLGVVHRDVSPQNILVGSDGVARVLDFGVAKAAGRMHVTQDGRIKGKFGYMPPEQLHAEVLDRRADIYASGVVLWETLVGARLFAGSGDAPDFARLLDPHVEPPSTRVRRLPHGYDAVVMTALAREAQGRFSTALEMAEALEACGPVAPSSEVGAWVMEVAGDLLAELSGRIAAIEGRLVAGIRDSLHLLESSDSRVTVLDNVVLPGTLKSTPPGLGAAVAAILSPPPPAPPPPSTRAPPLAVADTPGPRSSFPRSDPLPARGSAALWTGVAALGGLAIVATFAVIASVPGAPAAVSAEPSGTAAADVAPAEAASAARTSPPPPSAAPASAEPASSAPAPPTSSPRARVTPPTPPPHVAPPPRQAEGCSPPFTIDAAGHKHYKRECLK